MVSVLQMVQEPETGIVFQMVVYPAKDAGTII